MASRKKTSSPTPGPTPAPAATTIEGTGGNDVIIGTSLSETVRVLAGNDQIDGVRATI